MKPVTLTEGADESANGEQPSSVLKILDGALRAIARRGARRLSMSDISDASGVSRGTLYRYFSSKEEVLAAVSEFVCVNFEDGIRAAGVGIEDPIERFRAVMEFYETFTRERTPEHILEFEPGFHLEFFRNHFARHKAATHDALEPVFDYFQARMNTSINRDAIVEIIVRTQLSSLIVPVSERWSNWWRKSPDELEKWVGILTGYAMETHERTS